MATTKPMSWKEFWKAFKERVTNNHEWNWIEQLCVPGKTYNPKELRGRKAWCLDKLGNFMDTFDIMRLVNYLKYRFVRKHQYHILRLGKPGYSDVTCRMFKANFLLLEQFMENEVLLDKEIVEWEWDSRETCDARIEMEEIYRWWKARPFRQEIVDNLDIDSELLFQEYLKLEEEEDEMLIRLIKIRGYLWT